MSRVGSNRLGTASNPRTRCRRRKPRSAPEPRGGRGYHPTHMRRAIAIVTLGILTACAPLGASPFGGGASSSSGSIGAPVGADAQAQDLLFGAWIAVTAGAGGGGGAQSDAENHHQ